MKRVVGSRIDQWWERPVALRLVTSAMLLIYPTASPAGTETSNLARCGYAEAGAVLSKEEVSLPPVGDGRIADIGGTLLSTGRVVVYEMGLTLLDELAVTGTRAGADYVVHLPSGQMTPADRRNGLYIAKSATFRYEREKTERRGLSKPEIAIFFDPAGRSLMANINTGISSKNIPLPQARFELRRCQRESPTGLRREVLYSGAAKGIISLQYREYMDNVARPAFTQVLTFDLAEGNEIAFKGARIHIVGISNLGLQYRVLKSLGSD